MGVHRLRWGRKTSLLWLLWPVIAIAAMVTADQVASAIVNSPTANAFLKAHAAEIGALAIQVESGGDTTAYNGSCCYGVLQLNTTNILASGMTPTQYRNATLQQQIDAWSQVQSQALNDPVIGQLQGMSTFDGQPVDASFLLACVQMGQGNCRTMVQSGSCSGFHDANGTTICQMASTMRSAIAGSDGTGDTTGGTGDPNGGLGAPGSGGGSYSPPPSTAPGTAFQQAAGLSMAQAGEAIRLAAAALFALWLAWVTKGSWLRFVDGAGDMHRLRTTVLRAMGVALVVFFLLQ